VDIAIDTSGDFRFQHGNLLTVTEDHEILQTVLFLLRTTNPDYKSNPRIAPDVALTALGKLNTKYDVGIPLEANIRRAIRRELRLPPQDLNVTVKPLAADKVGVVIKVAGISKDLLFTLSLRSGRVDQVETADIPHPSPQVSKWLTRNV